MIFFASTLKSSNFRKPNRGMWLELLKILNVGTKEVCFENSFYCGDAAGRPDDHSSDDMLFARAIELKFMTPEMLFLNEKINFKPVSGLKIESKYEEKIDPK